MCITDIPRGEAICQSTNGDDQYRVGIDKLDNNVCFVPREWESLQNYVHHLEAMCPMAAPEEP